MHFHIYRVSQIVFCRLRIFFDIQFKDTLNLIFLGFKVPSEEFFLQEFPNRSYFLKYVVLGIAKLSSKLSTYRWDLGHSVKSKKKKTLPPPSHTHICLFRTTLFFGSLEARAEMKIKTLKHMKFKP